MARQIWLLFFHVPMLATVDPDFRPPKLNSWQGVFRILVTVSQIDVSASLISYTCSCASAILQNPPLNYCMFGVRKSVFSE